MVKVSSIALKVALFAVLVVVAGCEILEDDRYYRSSGDDHYRNAEEYHRDSGSRHRDNEENYSDKSNEEDHQGDKNSHDEED